MILIEIEQSEAKDLLAKVDRSKFNFEVSILEKALTNPSNEWYVLLEHGDSDIPLAFVTVDTDSTIDSIPYLSELSRVSDVRGVGVECIKQLMKNYHPKFWLQAMPLGDGESEPYRNNEELCNKFYRKIPDLIEYKVKNSTWNIDASFFYTKNCNKNKMEKELQKRFEKIN